jgi:hypothetical protein
MKLSSFILSGNPMLRWFNASEAQKFGITLAEFFIERVPMEEPGRKSKSIKRKEEVIQKMVQQIKVYRINNKLNIFQKAKLGNAFKWKLLNENYPSDFVDELTKTLLVNF